jgi:uncharacterized protein (DUF2267 family)
MEVSMSATGLEVFDKSIHITNVWLKEINAEIGPDRHLAWKVLGAVLRAMRDSIPLPLGAHFSASLPLVVRGAYYDQFRPTDAMCIENADDFISCIAEELETQRPLDPEDTIAAVFQVLNHHMPPGLIDKVRQALPRNIRSLWPEYADAPVRRFDRDERSLWDEGRTRRGNGGGDRWQLREDMLGRM